MSAYRDAAGRSLEDYPRPSVAVDTAVLTIRDGALGVLLVRPPDSPGTDPHGATWCLPGTFLHPGETLASAVDRSLRDKAGAAGLRPQQLHVFDAPDRDDRGWVLSVAHLDVVRSDRVPPDPRTTVTPVETVPALPYDHHAIIELAVAELRARYATAPDPFGLLEPHEPDGSFTLRELRLTHEAVAGHPLPPDAFRRSVENALVGTGRLSQGRRGKPAALHRRRR